MAINTSSDPLTYAQELRAFAQKQDVSGIYDLCALWIIPRQQSAEELELL